MKDEGYAKYMKYISFANSRMESQPLVQWTCAATGYICQTFLDIPFNT